jgi:hypothetical protein
VETGVAPVAVRISNSERCERIKAVRIRAKEYLPIRTLETANSRHHASN